MSRDALSHHIESLRGRSLDFADAWRELIGLARERLLTLDQRLELRFAAEQAWAEDALRPIWVPTADEIEATNLARLMRERTLDSYEALHRWSVDSPDEFWDSMIDRLSIRFAQAPSRVLDLTPGPEAPAWLVDAHFNIAESCFQAGEDECAIVVGDPDGRLSSLTYGQLRERANRVANGAVQLGLVPGSRVAILMPMTSDSVAIYLGLLLAGCTIVSIADSFAAAEIQRRLTIAGASAIVCLHHFRRGAKEIDLYARVIESDAPRAIVITDAADATLRDGDLLWHEFLGKPTFEVIRNGPDHPINVLFSSGTTGDPKAIPWDQTTPIKAASDGLFHQDIRPGDVVVWPTNLGWMMGPWLIFATLINRGAIGLYDDAPAGASFGKFVQDAGVTMLGVVPTLVRSWRASKCMEGFDWSLIRCFSSTGEASNADDMVYLSALAEFKPIIEYCGGTEIGGGYITSTMVQPNVAGAFSAPAMGNRFVILDDEGAESEEGQLYLVPPCMGLSRALLNRDHHATYYEGCPQLENRRLRRHGDYFRRLPHGYYVAGGRADDTMNLGGIKVSSAEIEAVLNGLEAVSETAAIAIPTSGGGPDQLVVYAVLRDQLEQRRLKSEMNRALKAELNPLFRVSEVIVADALPRTASNKVMRRELRRTFEAQGPRRSEEEREAS